MIPRGRLLLNRAFYASLARFTPPRNHIAFLENNLTICLPNQDIGVKGLVRLASERFFRAGSRPDPTGGHLPQRKHHCSTPPEKQQIRQSRRGTTTAPLFSRIRWSQISKGVHASR
ncbi:hypothetical protein KY290_014310 [Solanum tuberosum]|uniref:Uncharacterized protein n=1 Tax=Solanum tuberosum TaxID=4113 RepID=A0ABQ7VPC6_SOLTU|nr:hypothetical protein KY289_014370 [Solanum tuberosum]KAH0699493.1 hypothetical protein KY284_013708 [Solanum tuberosum]KAH0770329.1 hypothetical protein KY290_014310 [Solanum tuberosum]